MNGELPAQLGTLFYYNGYLLLSYLFGFVEPHRSTPLLRHFTLRVLIAPAHVFLTLRGCADTPVDQSIAQAHSTVRRATRIASAPVKPVSLGTIKRLL